MKQGFTLVELVIVTIIISILATMGFIEYKDLIESFRKSEAKTILGQLRQAQVVYSQDHPTYGNIKDLGLGLPTTSGCNPQYYFYYDSDPVSGTCRARRCVEGSSGKNPNVSITSAYTISLSIGANFSQTGYGVP